MTAKTAEFAAWPSPHQQWLGSGLLDQQVWCWGQDVMAAGNALIAHGFARCQTPPGETGSRAYLLQPAPDCRIALWAFGVFYARQGQGAIFLPRHRFAAQIMQPSLPPAAVWHPDHLKPFYAPKSKQADQTARRLLAEVATWIAGYETWIGNAYGPGHREQTLVGWRRAVVPAEKMADAWQSLARACVDSV